MTPLQRFRPRSLIIISIGLTLCGLGLLLSAGSISRAQEGDQASAEYVGEADCSGCHKTLSRNHATSSHALALQDVTSEKEAIKADFTAGETERTVLFPDDSSPRPVTPDDIDFIIGSGRYVERYLFRVSRTKYAILPIEWNVVKKAWQPYVRGQSADKWTEDPAYEWAKNCAGCHTTGLNVSRGRWTDPGVQCEACHGPGSLHVEAVGKAGDPPSDTDLEEIHKAITLTPDAQVCGQCHSQGTEPDGNLPFPVKYLPKANLLDKAVFNLVPSNDKDHWWETGHASQMNMQFNEWLKSGHAKSLETMQSSKEAAPACLECHSADYRLSSVLIAAQKAGNRLGDPMKLPTLQQAKFSVTCMSCHDPHGDSKAPAQLAAKDSYTLCTACHRATDVTQALHHPTREMFEGLTVIKDMPGIPSAHFADAKGPRCQTCHMSSVPVQGTTNVSHTFQLVMPGKANGKLPDSCSGCHDTLKPNDLQSLIDGTQDAVRSRLAVAWARVGTVAKPDQPGKAADSYNAIVNALTFVQNDGSLGVHNYAYADALLNYAERALSELSVPGAKVQPTEGPAPTAVSAAPAPVNTNAASSVPTGLRPPTVISLGFFGLILLIGAVAIFRKSGKGEA